MFADQRFPFRVEVRGLEVFAVGVDGELHAASIEPDVGCFVFVGIHAVADDVRDGVEVAEGCHGSFRVRKCWMVC